MAQSLVHDIGQFLDYILGDEVGVAYLATKDPHKQPPANWKQHFYDWPDQKDKLIDDAIRLNQTGLDVFYSPSLYTGQAALKDTWKGTRFAWTEFDGNAPETPKGGAPIPSVVIKSSVKGHEHWYWRLDKFYTDQEVLERLNEKLTYSLGADRSVWNSNKVLRIPGLKHQQKNIDSELISMQEDFWYTLDEFSSIKEPPPRAKLKDLPPVEKLPPVESIIARFKWTEDSFNLFMMPTVTVGLRSSLLTKLGHTCVDMGMSDLEALSVLLHADNRWKKFKNRDDQLLRLHGIIVYCRSRRKEQQEILFEPEGLITFLKKTTKVDWIIDGLIYRKSLVVVGGPPGVGKSLLSLQFCLQAGLGSHFLNWPVRGAQRLIFISMEMNRQELKAGLSLMTETLTPTEMEQLEDNFMMIPLGAAVNMAKINGQELLYGMMERHRPDGVIFDSLGMAVDDVSDAVTIKTAFDFVDHHVRKEFGAFVYFIHHPRKGTPGNRKPRDLDDLYGNRYITQSASTALGLWPTSSKNTFSMSFLKTRLGNFSDSIVLRRDPKTLLTSVYSSTQPVTPKPKEDVPTETGTGEGGILGM